MTGRSSNPDLGKPPDSTRERLTDAIDVLNNVNLASGLTALTGFVAESDPILELGLVFTVSSVALNGVARFARLFTTD